MNGYEADILSQPEDIRRALEFYRGNGYAEKLAEFASKSYKNIVFTGMGGSYISCYNAVTMLRNMGFPAMKIPSSQLLHFETRAIAEDSLLVCVSQSGESAEVVGLLKELPEHKNLIGITNDMGSTLGKRADLALDMRVAPERTVSTRTYLASLAINHILAHAICGGTDGYDDVAYAVDCLEESLKDFNGVSERVDGFFGLPPYQVMLARGFSLCSAEIGALYIAEVAKYPVIPFDAGQFRHGPLELVSGNFHCAVFAPESGCHDLQIKIAEQIAANGGKVLLITDSDYNGGGSIIVVKQKYPCAELECFVNVSAAQVIANNIAKRKGLEVGEFFHSSKITSVQ
jgi:glucosamine--fructose-6-phosphate aminotransferase (isomerizing)